mmetsp:Transcript_14916/g.24333  ORF Transcript_14916/g.24333 Transcript_14916/m.24333 type:complete len:233 (-) Transcript_14916:69-767(-)
MMNIQIVIFRIKHIDLKRCKIFLCLGNQYQCILISNPNVVNVIFIFFLIVILFIEFIIVHGHILQIFKSISFISTSLSTDAHCLKTLQVKWGEFSCIRNIGEIIFIFAIIIIAVNIICINHHFGILANKQPTNLIFPILIIGIIIHTQVSWQTLWIHSWYLHLLLLILCFTLIIIVIIVYILPIFFFFFAKLTSLNLFEELLLRTRVFIFGGGGVGPSCGDPFDCGYHCFRL